MSNCIETGLCCWIVTSHHNVLLLFGAILPNYNHVDSNKYCGCVRIFAVIIWQRNRFYVAPYYIISSTVFRVLISETTRSHHNASRYLDKVFVIFALS
jgi:hypothetical protein